MPNNLAAEFSKFLAGKTVVVDTSSLLLAGTNLLTILPQCKLVIPSIVVQELEEKRAHTTVGFLAREWLRLLEELRLEYDKELRDGVPASSKYPYVSIRVEPNNTKQGKLPEHLRNGSHDSTILAVAKNLSENLDVVLLSNDAPMRLHATIDLHLPAVEFSATLAGGAEPFTGITSVELDPYEYSEVTSASRGKAEALADLVEASLPAELPSHSLVLAHVEDTFKPAVELVYENGFLTPLRKRGHHTSSAYNVKARSVEQATMLHYLKTDPSELPIVSVMGGAGTGKTLLSVAVGLEELEKGLYQRLLVFRSLTEMGRGQEMGFLPGDVGEKMEAWAGAVYDALDIIALHNIKPSAKAAVAVSEEAKKLRQMVEVSPITYLRGRSLSNTYIIVEEAQNFSRSELLNILSRVGEGTKMVFTGDPDQVDSKFLQAGEKADIWSVVNDLKNEDVFAHITLSATERSRVASLAAKILARK